MPLDSTALVEPTAPPTHAVIHAAVTQQTFGNLVTQIVELETQLALARNRIAALEAQITPPLL